MTREKFIEYYDRCCLLDTECVVDDIKYNYDYNKDEIICIGLSDEFNRLDLVLHPFCDVVSISYINSFLKFDNVDFRYVKRIDKMASVASINIVHLSDKLDYFSYSSLMFFSDDVRVEYHGSYNDYLAKYFAEHFPYFFIYLKFDDKRTSMHLDKGAVDEETLYNYILEKCDKLNITYNKFILFIKYKISFNDFIDYLLSLKNYNFLIYQGKWEEVRDKFIEPSTGFILNVYCKVLEEMDLRNDSETDSKRFHQYVLDTLRYICHIATHNEKELLEFLVDWLEY